MILVKPSFEILTEIDGSLILRRIEAAGRTCYKSEDRITEESAKQFVRGIIKRGHYSVIEHESIAVRIICDRGVTHEIVRHRLCAYSQESTRYCNYSGGVTFVIPPWVTGEPGRAGEYTDVPPYWETPFNADQLWFSSLLDHEAQYVRLLELGWSPQQARSVLPNSLKTEIVMTANLREWRHIFSLRCSRAAHPQMREVMIPLCAEFIKQIPIVFDDLVSLVS